MRTRIKGEAGLIGMGLIILLGGMGCATTSDLQKLNQEVNQELESLNAKVQTQVDNLHKELTNEIKSQGVSTRKTLTKYIQKSDQALARIEASNDKFNTQLAETLDQKLESLNTTVQKEIADVRTELMQAVESEAASTRRVVTEYEKEREQALARIEAFNDKLTKHLQSVRQAVAPVLELPRYFAGVNEKMRSIGQALLGNYKGEEAALRSRLKVLEQARKELEPVVADQGVEAMSRQ